MREYIVSTLFLLFPALLPAQAAPAGWKVLKDSKGLCQIAVPPEWDPLADTKGAAIFRDSSIAIAVVTSQPGQGFKPLPASLQKVLNLRKENIFENTTKRVFYQDRVSRDAENPNAYSASVPGKDGTCSCRVTFLPDVSEETAKKIALSLSAAPE